ncbi:MAG: hypothetical protein ACR2P1_27465 [Pseudomonadales bacterium]
MGQNSKGELPLWRCRGSSHLLSARDPITIIVLSTEIAQTTSEYLKKLVNIGVLSEQQVGRER